jgi:hypothetical protein
LLIQGLEKKRYLFLGFESGQIRGYSRFLQETTNRFDFKEATESKLHKDKYFAEAGKPDTLALLQKVLYGLFLQQHRINRFD